MVGLLDGLKRPKAIDFQAHFSGSAAFVGQAAVGVFEKALHFGGGAGEGLVDIEGILGGYERSMVFWAGFKKTAFLDRSARCIFSVGFAGEMNIDADEVWFESPKNIADVGPDGIGKLA